MVYPTWTVLAENPVSMVDKVADRRGRPLRDLRISVTDPPAFRPAQALHHDLQAAFHLQQMINGPGHG